MMHQRYEAPDEASEVLDEAPDEAPDDALEVLDEAPDEALEVLDEEPEALEDEEELDLYGHAPVSTSEIE
ncbi:hypothetical protein PMKS-004214 [Pichia membranifaciens]|uniref:Uncharacterized protein n=1 Tax=Pichia membranifaciens TaxID=4926 RepID=A0A1Q2YMB9_9ASCO|nr:hypothetical protein PMKS-004214 [Pichia membranifaciens]